MAKTSLVQRENKRTEMVKKYAQKRQQLKDTIKNANLSLEERWEAQRVLQSLPRDSSPVRRTGRCAITGRARGYYRKFDLGRNELRRLAMFGHIPGLLMASW